MIIKNTDPYKLKKCTSCKISIPLQEKYFTYPLSFQVICLQCALREIPKILGLLEADLTKIRESQSDTKSDPTGMKKDIYP
jgi:predicted RNA-binding Zn-ribbon protein involved in translation (DUF1610 family)